MSRLITPSQRRTEDTSALLGLAIIARWRQRQSAPCVGIPVSALTLKLFWSAGPPCVQLAVPVVIFSLALGLNALAASPNGQGAAGRHTDVPSQGGVNREVPQAATPMTTSPPRGHEASDIRTEGRSTSELLTNNTKLASQVHDLTGADAQQACSGFKNLGECVSAAHASKNLGIEFDALKAKMTGASAQDLGDAIHDLKPDTEASSEAHRANRQAKDDPKASGQ